MARILFVFIAQVLAVLPQIDVSTITLVVTTIGTRPIADPAMTKKLVVKVAARISRMYVIV